MCKIKISTLNIGLVASKLPKFFILYLQKPNIFFDQKMLGFCKYKMKKIG